MQVSRQKKDTSFLTKSNTKQNARWYCGIIGLVVRGMRKFCSKKEMKTTNKKQILLEYNKNWEPVHG